MAGIFLLILIGIFSYDIVNHNSILVIGYNRPQGLLDWSFVLTIILFGCSFIFRPTDKNKHNVNLATLIYGNKKMAAINNDPAIFIAEH